MSQGFVVPSEPTQLQADTFEGIARSWISADQAHWGAAYLKQVEDTLAREVYPWVGSMPIQDIGQVHLLAIIQRVVVAGKPNVARLIRAWCQKIWQHAGLTLNTDRNPAVLLQGVVRKPLVQHAAILTSADLPSLMMKLGGYGGRPESAIALRLMLLTFVRANELRQAVWSEFDLERQLWSIPGHRMKMRQPHLVPLARQAVCLIHELRDLNRQGQFLFPKQTDSSRCIGVTTINKVLTYLGYAGRFSGQGFRGTASTLLLDLGWPPRVVDTQLAHTKRNRVEADLLHALYLDQRRAMMQAWADWLDTIAPPVWREPVIPVSFRDASQSDHEARSGPRFLTRMRKSQF